MPCATADEGFENRNILVVFMFMFIFMIIFMFIFMIIFMFTIISSYLHYIMISLCKKPSQLPVPGFMPLVYPVGGSMSARPESA